MQGGGDGERPESAGGLEVEKAVPSARVRAPSRRASACSLLRSTRQEVPADQQPATDPARLVCYEYVPPIRDFVPQTREAVTV